MRRFSANGYRRFGISHPHNLNAVGIYRGGIRR